MAGLIHAILGEDTYLAEVALERVLSEALGSDRDEALEVLYGDETRWPDVVARARMRSLFCPRRVLLVRRADQIKGDEEAVAAYLEDPSPDVTLVLLAAKPDRRRVVWKRVLAAATVHPADPKRGQALRGHVEGELRRRGLQLAPEAVGELIDRVGQDLRRLMGEVEKLEAFAGEGKSVSAEDVAAVLGRGFAPPLYRLADAIAARDLAASLELLDELLREGEEGLRILGTLHRSLRQVRAAGALREGGSSAADIGRRLLPANMQFKARALVEASRRWSDPELRRAFDALGRADQALKRGVDAEAALAAAIAEAGAGGAFRPSPRRWR